MVYLIDAQTCLPLDKHAMHLDFKRKFPKCQTKQKLIVVKTCLFNTHASLLKLYGKIINKAGD